MADEPTHFGSGWISGVLSVGLSLIGLCAVICFHYPSWLTVPELRTLYPVPYIRALLHLILVAAFALGILNICLWKRRWLGTAGILITLLTALLGGSRVPIEGELSKGPFLGLDWFLLNLMAFSVVFIPLERFFALHAEQRIFRSAWRTDLIYFFVSAILVQATTLITLKPAMVLFHWASATELRAWTGKLPYAIQFLGILLVSDFAQYWVHRIFHVVPALWRFHAIHHSAESMDWLAGSRLHLVDVAITRGLTYIPIYILGFSDTPLAAYILFVSVQATFIHANVRWDFGPLGWLLATPRFHHWHHAAEHEAIDKNFAVHLPILDWIFGTYFQPTGRWPKAYGLCGGEPIPDGFTQQFVHPFRAQKKNSDSPQPRDPI